MKQIVLFTLFFFGIGFSGHTLYAQDEEDNSAQINEDLGEVTDAFQEHFFEALKQKGIENYELALEALQKAEKAVKQDPKQKAVIYFEMGKNLASLNRYDEAEANFLRVLETQNNQMDVLEALYDVYYEQSDYEKAIPLVIQLSKIDIDYKEDLANLYSRTKQYDEAIKVLDELDETLGESNYRDALRTNIYRLTGNKEGEIAKLEEKVDNNSKNERDYLNLIYLYSQDGDTKKAFETAKELLKNNPSSQLVHLSLYKFYLDEGNTTEALKSINKVFASTNIETEDKYKLLSDFIQFVTKNPSFEPQLEQLITDFSGEANGNLYEKIGAYFIAKGNKEKALAFYEKGAQKDDDNFSLLRNTMLLQVEMGKYEEVIALSTKSLEIFPAQPILYLLNGVAHNNLSKSEDAIEILEAGLDFLFDNPVMEKDFYEQLKIAYTAKGDPKNSKKYADKAAAIILTN
ncbi:tetratricopeptide repeat protein [Jejudonia soesokkakensis]|uniref:Tetratricopeptide repeat protein n=1 Tax=Jejudonia soesokkakensis TaxID=1323432 RepID=A0ABW2MTH7_9FLAO